jgi:hypothetical protein
VTLEEKDTVVLRCRLCGHGRPTLVGKNVGRYRRASFHFYRCQRCSFVFVSPVLGSEIYDEAHYRGHGADKLVDYEHEYRDYRQTPRIFESQDLISIAEKHFVQRVQALPQEVAWLDFGCGAGALLKFLRNRMVLKICGVTHPLLVSGCDVGSYAERLARNDGFKISLINDWKYERAASPLAWYKVFLLHSRDPRQLFQPKVTRKSVPGSRPGPSPGAFWWGFTI